MRRGGARPAGRRARAAALRAAPPVRRALRAARGAGRGCRAGRADPGRWSADVPGATLRPGPAGAGRRRRTCWSACSWRAWRPLRRTSPVERLAPRARRHGARRRPAARPVQPAARAGRLGWSWQLAEPRPIRYGAGPHPGAASTRRPDGARRARGARVGLGPARSERMTRLLGQHPAHRGRAGRDRPARGSSAGRASASRGGLRPLARRGGLVAPSAGARLLQGRGRAPPGARLPRRRRRHLAPRAPLRLSEATPEA